MPVGFDRFLRVISGGKYSSLSLLKVRKDKVQKAVTALEQSVQRLRELDAEQTWEFEAELKRYQEALREAQALEAQGDPPMDKLRAACERLEPIKELAQQTQIKADKIVAKLGSMERIGKSGPADEQRDLIDEKLRTGDALTLWTEEVRAARRAIETAKAGVNNPKEQAAVLATHARNLTKLYQLIKQDNRLDPKKVQEVEQTTPLVLGALEENRKTQQGVHERLLTSDGRGGAGRWLATMNEVEKALEALPDPTSVDGLYDQLAALDGRKDTVIELIEVIEKRNTENREENKERERENKKGGTQQPLLVTLKDQDINTMKQQRDELLEAIQARKKYLAGVAVGFLNAKAQEAKEAVNKASVGGDLQKQMAQLQTHARALARLQTTIAEIVQNDEDVSDPLLAETVSSSQEAQEAQQEIEKTQKSFQRVQELLLTSDGKVGANRWCSMADEVRVALLEVPTGANAMIEQMAVLETHKRNLTDLLALIEKTNKENIKNNQENRELIQKHKIQLPIYPTLQESAIAELKKEHIELVKAIDNRKQQLKAMADNHPLTEKQLFRSKALEVAAAIQVIDKALPKVANNPQAVESLQQVRGELVQRKKMLEDAKSNTPIKNIDLVLGGKKPGLLYNLFMRNTVKKEVATGGLGSRPLSSSQVSEDEVMHLVLANAFTKAGLSTKHLDHQLHDAQIKALNDQDWQPIEKPVMVQYDGKPVQLTSTITPMSNLDPKYKDQGIKGVCSHDTKAYKTAANLAVTELKDKQGQVLFSGLRHGINSAYGITPQELEVMDRAELRQMVQDLLPQEQWAKIDGAPNLDKTVEELQESTSKLSFSKNALKKSRAEAMRKAANLNRATDVVTAALYQDKKKLAEALRTQKATVTLHSISLVTPDMFRSGASGEKSMLADQMEAWEALKKSSPRKIKIKAEDGSEVEVEVTIKVIAFNFGVNAGAVAMGPLSMSGITSGAHTSDKYNQQALDDLRGQVTEWLNASKDAVTEKEKAWKEARQRGDEAQVLEEKELNDWEHKREVVRKLYNQIIGIWNTYSDRSQGNEPYKMVSRLAVLTHLMGATPAFNCKSGKDRTGQLDVEAKLLATQIAQTGDVPEPDHKPDEVEKSNRLSMAINSGNHEMQQLNTGHMGFKLENKLWKIPLRSALDESLPDKEGVKTFKGTSKRTKA